MALSVDEISALTENLWIPLIADNVFTSNPVMARLWTRGPKVVGGVAIRAPLMYAQVGAAGAISGFDVMNIDADDQFTAADFQWKEYYAAIVLSRREMFQNAGAPEQIDHAAAKAQAAEMTLRDLMGTGLFSDATDTKTIDGLETAVTTTGTYPSGGGGIDAGTETWWAAGFRDTTAQAITTATNVFPMLQEGVGNTTEQPNSPTIIVTDQAIFNTMFAAFEDNQRFHDDTLASMGFESIMFRRIPIVVDSHCPTGITNADGGSVYFLNENFLQLYTHRDENFRFDPFKEPINQKVMVAKLFWTGNLVCNNRRFQGTFTRVNFN